MCLVLDRDNLKMYPDVTEKDITVYKVFMVHKHHALNRLEYRAPYREYYYPDMNTTYKESMFEMNLRRKELGYIDYGYHSFAYWNEAVRELNLLSQEALPEDTWYEIVPCIIPKGTRYYRGYFNMKSCYCSEQLKLDSSL